MPFDPLSIIGYFGTAAGLLSFIASTIENTDKRWRDYKQCRTRLQQYHHSVETSGQYFKGWIRIWCEGDHPYSEETYKYFWGEDGFAKMCQRVDVVRNCFSEVSDLLYDLPEGDKYTKETDLEQWRLVAETVERGGVVGSKDSSDWRYRISFALYENAALKTAVENLKTAVDQLFAFSAATFWELRDEANLKKDLDVDLLERFSKLKRRVDDWSNFMHKLHYTHTKIGTHWALALRLPDPQGSPESLATDSDMEINFVSERCVLQKHFWAGIHTVRYPKDSTDPTNHTKPPILGEVSNSYASEVAVPITKAISFRYVLNEISQSIIEHQQKLLFATRLERAEGALGLVNWVILLWNTPWIPELCTCAIRSTFYTDNACHFTLHWKDIVHVHPPCVIAEWQGRKYFHLGVALTELAIGVPLRLKGEADTAEFRLDPESEFPLHLLRHVGRRTSHRYREAVEYCFRMDEKRKTNGFQPENIEKDANKILNPVQEYYDCLRQHQQTQERRNWRHQQAQEKRDWLRVTLSKYQH